MLRDIVTVLIVVGLALGLGAWSADEASREFAGFGQLSIGGWSAQISEGSPDAEAYTRAYGARRISFPLGGSEGVYLRRSNDDAGEPLVSNCRYVLAGTMAAARAWTLSIKQLNEEDEPIAKRTLASSYSVTYEPDSTLLLTLSDAVAPGNWRPLDVEGPFALELALYDTPINSSTGIKVPQLPALTKAGCDAS